MWYAAAIIAAVVVFALLVMDSVVTTRSSPPPQRKVAGPETMSKPMRYSGRYVPQQQSGAYGKLPAQRIHQRLPVIYSPLP